MWAEACWKSAYVTYYCSMSSLQHILLLCLMYRASSLLYICGVTPCHAAFTFLVLTSGSELWGEQRGPWWIEPGFFGPDPGLAASPGAWWMSCHCWAVWANTWDEWANSGGPFSVDPSLLCLATICFVPPTRTRQHTPTWRAFTFGYHYFKTKEVPVTRSFCAKMKCILMWTFIIAKNMALVQHFEHWYCCWNTLSLHPPVRIYWQLFICFKSWAKACPVSSGRNHSVAYRDDKAIFR